MQRASKMSPKNKTKKQAKTNKKELSATGKWPYLVFVGVVLLFAAIAGLSVFRSKATSYVVNTVEAENFTTIPADASVVSDTNASGGKLVKLVKTNPIKTAVTLAGTSDSLGVTVKGQSCKYAPRLIIVVDVVAVSTVRIGNTQLAETSINKTLVTGSHTVELSLEFEYATRKCVRSISIDKVVFYSSQQQVVTTPTPTASNVFSTSFSSTQTAGWSSETSGSAEKIVIQNNRAECTAGGYAATTHYARMRRKLPEQDNFAAKKDFIVRANFELPSNFYSQQESYMRFFNTDNFPGVYKSTGATVGALTADEWRVGLLVFGGDKLLRLQSAHENHTTLTLWKASQQLPVGRHDVELSFVPSKTNTGSWELNIDGVKVGGQTGVQTVPSSVQDSEVAVTRVVGCIDGAADQDTKQVQMYLYTLNFTATQ